MPIKAISVPSFLELPCSTAPNSSRSFEHPVLFDAEIFSREDITTCQQTHGKTITLSIGGATYSEGGFSSTSEAQAAAELVWATFGPNQNKSITSDGTKIYRPFGDASVDGFDFDFESTVSNMAPFAQALRSLMDATEATDGKHRLLTAAPQCPFPDAADDQFLSGALAVKMDAVFVQFYNNYCGVQSFVSGSSTQNNFNFEAWDKWAKSSKNPAVKVSDITQSLFVPGADRSRFF